MRKYKNNINNFNLKKISNTILCFIIFLSFNSNLNAQFILSSSGQRIEKLNKTKSTNRLLIPIFEDFSNYSGSPNPSLWEESNVLINTGFSYNSPSVGVATLDCLDRNGLLYPKANTTGFSADTLTSRAIRLDSAFSPSPKKLTLEDSLYFSFAFQPGGGFGEIWESLGSTPGLKDSLILQFYNPDDDLWNTVWSTPGFSLDSIYHYDSIFFRFISIPINNSKYLNKDFRFRFRNYASLDANPSYAYVGNSDNWNIDYIYLDKQRSWSEKTYRDIAFVDKAPTMLKVFQAMPSRQFTQNDMGDSLNIKIINLFDQTLISIYKYHVFDSLNNIIGSYDGGFENIEPYLETKSFQTSPNHARAPINFKFSFDSTRWAKFKIVHSLKLGVGQDVHPNNDTISFNQVFENYYAYDDGTSENGFGIEPIKNSNLALEFNLNTPDTLTAVDIYFNSTYENANQKPFYLCVWSSQNNVPYDSIYRSSILTPTTPGLNKFKRYILDRPVILSGEKFFISLQTKGKDYLNIGFDRNTNSSEYILGNWANSWEKTFIKGSLMIRPYFGKNIEVGLKEEIKKGFELEVYPNPTKGLLNIKTQNINSEIRILNIMGQMVHKSNYKSNIDISSLEPGIYILYLIDKETMSSSQRKIIVSK